MHVFGVKNAWQVRGKYSLQVFQINFSRFFQIHNLSCQFTHWSHRTLKAKPSSCFSGKLWKLYPHYSILFERKNVLLTLFLSNLSMWVSDFSSFRSPESPSSPYTQMNTLEFVPALETSPVNTCTRYVFSKKKIKRQQVSYRAVFTWVSKSNSFCTTTIHDWLRKLAPLFSSNQNYAEPTVTISLPVNYMHLLQVFIAY